jgi:hypothetical protein
MAISKEQSGEYRQLHQKLQAHRAELGPNQTRMLEIMDDAFSTGLGSQMLQGLSANMVDDVIGSMRPRSGDLKELSGLLKKHYKIEMAPGELGRLRESEAVDTYQQENPGTAIAGQMAGTLPYMFLPGGQAAAASRLPLAYKALTQGAKAFGIGSAYGAGKAGMDAPAGEIAQAALADGTISGGIGGGLPVAGAALKGLANLPRNVYDRVMPGRSPVDRAGNEVAYDFARKAAADDGLTWPGIADQLDAATKPMVAGHLGTNMTQLLDTVHGRAGLSRKMIEDRLNKISEGSVGRMGDDLSALSGGNKGSYFTSLREMLKSRKETGDKLYDAAYATNIEVDPTLLEVLNRPVFRQGWKRAYDMAANSGAPMQKLKMTEAGIVDEAGDVVKEIPTQLLDYLKRAADNKISVGIGKREAVGDMITARDTMVDIVDEGNDAFKTARAFWSGEQGIIDAQKLGKNYQKLEDAEELIFEIEKMSSAEKDAFRFGMMTKLRDDIGGMVTGTKDAVSAGNKARNLLTKPKKIEMLKATFSSDKEYDQFIKAFKEEMQMESVRGQVLGNSATQTRQRWEKDWDAAINPQSSLGSLWKNIQRIKGQDRAAGTGEAASAELANILTGSADELRAMLPKLRPPIDPLGPVNIPKLPTLYPRQGVHPLMGGARGLLGDEDTSGLR